MRVLPAPEAVECRAKTGTRWPRAQGPRDSRWDPSLGPTGTILAVLAKARCTFGHVIATELLERRLLHPPLLPSFSEHYGCKWLQYVLAGSTKDCESLACP